MSKTDNLLNLDTTSTSRETQSVDRRIADLKKKLADAQKLNKSLTEQVPGKVNVITTSTGIKVQETLRKDGKTFHSDSVHRFGDTFTALTPILSPLVNITRAAVLGHDYTRRHQAHELDPQGRPTQELMRDKDGKQVYLANSLDRLEAIFSVIDENPQAKELLISLQKILEHEDQSIRDRASQIANRRRSADSKEEI